MINGKRIKELYNALDLEHKKEVSDIVFGNSRQSFNYFSNRRNITFRKVEMVADYFGVSMDSLRLENEGKEASAASIGKARNKKGVPVNSSLQEEKITMLNSQIEGLNTIVESQKDIIESLKDIIRMKDEKIASLQK